MAAYTDSVGFNKGAPAFPDEHHMHRIEVVLDFAAIATARAAAGLPALDATDTLEVMTLPGGSLVLAKLVEVLTAEGAAATADLGIAGTPTQWFSNADMNAVGKNLSAAAVPVLYEDDTAIIMTFDAALDAAKIRVVAFVADTNGYGMTFVSGRNL